MPANKRKKKPTSNPARGFATTSTASKTRSSGLQENLVEIGSNAINNDIAYAQDNAGAESEGPRIEAERPLQELSPEELEKQLEDSRLQLLIEKHGTKVKREVSRQVSRLQTERRLLRNQAMPLHIRQWLPEEIVQLVTYQLNQRQDSNFALDSVSESRQVEKSISEDDLLIKIWALSQILIQLGFLVDLTLSVLRHLLTIYDSQAYDSQARQELSTGKDSVWGLDACLSWLAFEAKSENLPRFDTAAAKTQSSRGHKMREWTNPDEAGSSTEASTTPPRDVSQNVSEYYSDEEEISSSQSDSDSDLEPDLLVDKYLGVQKRLYEIDPPSFEQNGKVQKGSRKGNTKKMEILDRKVKRTIDRLTAKLSKIKKDILFDEDQAQQRWTEMQIDLAKEAAERRRLGIGDRSSTTKQATVTNSSKPAKDVKNDEEALDMLGDLFINSSTPADGGQLDDDGVINTSVSIRDFGKWTGMSPRRVFEESCKSRDASVRITYKPISESSFSKRHSLSVHWAREQDSVTLLPIDNFKCESSTHSLKLEMTSVACPDALQSEAFISTVALFFIFASTPEQKVYMRLPSVWRILWDEYSEQSKEHTNAKDRDVLRELRDMIQESESSNHQTNCHRADDGDATIPTKNEPKSDMSGSFRAPIVPSSDGMKAIWTAKERTSSYQQMLPARLNLPIYGFKDDLLAAIADHQIVIVCGETGCGKSTQVPAYILENELSNGRSCKVYCTEPRRISAISLARRVSEELGERKGDVGTLHSLVGYAIRLESRISPQTRLVYATTGIVMRMLEGSDELKDITHLILDEVHERSIDSDFLLIVLRKLLHRRSDLKVILMSATVNAQRFSVYLNQAPILNVPGRTFPVVTKYLEDAIQETHFNPAASTDGKYGGEEEDDVDRAADASLKTSLSADNLRSYSADTCNALLKYDEYRLNYDLILKLLVVIATGETYSPYSKAILIFLPGIGEIRRLNDLLSGHSCFRDGWKIHSLHSTIAMEEQERAFLVPPKGTRKIVLATNIAETGVTIPDVTCVVDTGKHKEMRFDERRQLSRLIEVFISRANAKQRRGRAGRVQKGLCFHLFTRDRHDKILPEEQTPEMLRLSLQDLVLRVKICKLGNIEQTLGEALDPPSSKNIRRAIDSLIDVRALTTSEDLTPLGRRLAGMPLDVFLGKMVLLGAIFGCLDAMLTIAAILSSKSPFSASIGARSQMDVARLAFKKGDSDLLTIYNAYCAWRRVCGANGMSEFQFCRKNFLSQQTLSNIEDLKAQLATSIMEAGFLKLEDSEKAILRQIQSYSRKRTFVQIPARYNRNNDCEMTLNSVIAWSFYPKILRREGNGWRNTANNQTVSLHPTSVNKGRDCTSQWLSFYHIMQSNNKFYNAHETTSVEDIAIALVCGEADFKMYSGVMVIDGNRIRFSFEDWKTMSVIKTLRSQIRQVMAQSFRDPERALTQQQQGWLNIWEKIFALGKENRT